MRERRYRPYTSKYVLMFLAAASFFTVLLGLIMTVDQANFNKKAAVTEAVITDAYVRRTGSRRSGGRRYVCNAYLEYAVDGKEYSCIVKNFDRSYGYTSKSDYFGRTVTLLYDPDDPSDARPAGRKGAGVPLMIAGAVMAGMFTFFNRKNGYYEKLIKSGAVLDAVVVDIEHKTVVHYYRSRSRGFFGARGGANYTDEDNYRVIVCEWENPLTGQKYVFRSQRIKEFVEPYVGQTVRVYADPQNYEKYFVDVDDLLAKPFMNGKSKAFTYEKRQ